MVLSLTLINVPPPTEYESSAYTYREPSADQHLFGGVHRLKTNLYMLDELIQMYGYAEDLDTYEHAAKELSTFFAGPVSLTKQHFNQFLTTESDKRTGL